MTLKQALWEIVRDENIIITNQNIDWLLDRASKKASGDAQALKESILERKQVIEENIPCALTNEGKVSENGKLLLINENKSNNFEVKSNNELFKQALVEGLNRRFDKTIEEAKQIEAIANDINMHCCSLAEQFCGETSCNACLTNFLYNVGYRKQSEGENIALYPKSSFECSICNWSDWDTTTGDTNRYNYCPNCGAKMKGGEE